MPHAHIKRIIYLQEQFEEILSKSLKWVPRDLQRDLLSWERDSLGNKIPLPAERTTRGVGVFTSV